jgi:DNA helicase-2/ATP-dependent DNA helicase PcrA
VKKATVESQEVSRNRNADTAFNVGPLTDLAIGERVDHKKYGIGIVVTTEGEGVRKTATIDFGGEGKVRLMPVSGVPMVRLPA